MAAVKKIVETALVAKVFRWHQVITENKYRTLPELKVSFPSVDLIGDRIVFNPGAHRLIMGFHEDFRHLQISVAEASPNYAGRRDGACAAGADS